MPSKTKQFVNLMVLYLSESITDKEERELLDILNSDSDYKVRFDEMLKTRAISLIPVVESQKKSNYKQFIPVISSSLTLIDRPIFMQSLIRIAAILIFALSISVSGYYFFTDLGGRDTMMTYETIVPLGSQTKIVLPDGTIAWLNSGSILKYSNNYGSEDRTVYLNGEGYFDVQKNPKKPFFVYANDIRVKVLGTVFNVRSYSDEATVKVDLLEGKVDVSVVDKETNETLSLLPNQLMVYNKQNKSMQFYNADASRAATWTTGKLCFVDASLEDISKDLERKYDVQINIKAKNIKDELFSGSLDLNQTIDNVLEYLDVDKKYTREYNGKTISITNKN
jgi:transmembrane sensor